MWTLTENDIHIAIRRLNRIAANLAGDPERASSEATRIVLNLAPKDVVAAYRGVREACIRESRWWDGI